MFALFSIFSSNSYCGSVFSVMDNIRSDEKTRLGLDTLNALVSVKCNSDLDCTVFYQHMLSEKALLKEAKTNEKYSFR